MLTTDVTGEKTLSASYLLSVTSVLIEELSVFFTLISYFVLLAEDLSVKECSYSSWAMIVLLVFTSCKLTSVNTCHVMIIFTLQIPN